MSLITDLAGAITRFENVNPKYNNPGAIWNTKTNSIRQYDTYDQGYQALLNTVNAKVGRGYNLYQFMKEYAPKIVGDPIHGTNNPQHYAEVVGGWLGIDPQVPLASVGGAGGTGTPIAVVDGYNDMSNATRPWFDITTTLGVGSGIGTDSDSEIPWWLYAIGAAAGVYWLSNQ